jgi:hypothetical protein
MNNEMNLRKRYLTHIVEVKEMNDKMNLKRKISQDRDVIFCLYLEFL